MKNKPISCHSQYPKISEGKISSVSPALGETKRKPITKDNKVVPSLCPQGGKKNRSVYEQGLKLEHKQHARDSRNLS